MTTEKFLPPKKIHITSDDTVIEFVQHLPKNKNQKSDMYRYRYIKSIMNLGGEIDFSEEYLKIQLTNYFKAL